MKLFISLSSPIFSDQIISDLEKVRRAHDANMEEDYNLDFEDLDKSPVPIFHLGRTWQNTVVFFNYNYLLRGGRRAVTESNPNVVRFFIFRSDALLKNRSAPQLGYIDLVVDNPHKVKDILSIKRAYVTEDNLGKGIREELITSLLKTVGHKLYVYTVDSNSIQVLTNLGARDLVTNLPVSLTTKVAKVPFNLEFLTNRVLMSKSSALTLIRNNHE